MKPLLIGLITVIVGVVDMWRSRASFAGTTWPNSDRDEHPVLFWICIFSWLVSGLAFMVVGCTQWK